MFWCSSSYVLTSGGKGNIRSYRNLLCWILRCPNSVCTVQSCFHLWAIVGVFAFQCQDPILWVLTVLVPWISNGSMICHLVHLVMLGSHQGRRGLMVVSHMAYCVCLPTRTCRHICIDPCAPMRDSSCISCARLGAASLVGVTCVPRANGQTIQARS